MPSLPQEWRPLLGDVVPYRPLIGGTPSPTRGRRPLYRGRRPLFVPYIGDVVPYIGDVVPYRGDAVLVAYIFWAWCHARDRVCPCVKSAE